MSVSEAKEQESVNGDSSKGMVTKMSAAVEQQDDTVDETVVHTDSTVQ
jgi:hypothetical protein